MIMDEVMLGFRLARGGAQEYFGVRADMVTTRKISWGRTACWSVVRQSIAHAPVL